MPGSFLRKLGLSRREESSSDSDEEVQNLFTAPSDSPSPTSDTVFPGRPESIFSGESRSSITEGSKSTRQTKYTSGTGDTSTSLRTESSKRQRLTLVNLESGHQTPETVNVPETMEEVNSHLESLIVKMQALDQQTDGDNAPRISATLSRLISDYTAVFGSAPIEPSAIRDEPLSVVLRIVLGFTDVYLAGQQHTVSRMHLLRSLYHFAVSLDLLEDEHESNSFAPSSAMMDGGSITVPQPKVFAVGSTEKSLPNENLLMVVLDNLAARSAPLVEQEGAYVAPVLRGLSPRFSVATLCLGIPDMKREHFEAIMTLKTQLKNLHVYGRRDYITAAAVPMSSSSIKVPYRVPTDTSMPPMSISLATIGSNFVSGTLGGFLYPHSKDPRTADRNVYALTCGHVCLQSDDEHDRNAKDSTGPFGSEVAYPSPVLQKLFKKALAHQSSRFGPDSVQHKAFKEAMEKVDQQPSTVLGEVVWGERTCIAGRMSDIAVIKCKPGIECRNWLGNDIDLSQYDPTLIMNQLRVKGIVGKSRGLPVFKYGSTSKYTTGVVSSLRIAYWASGVLQTSEFAIRSGDSTAFANAGDSGAWILASNPDGLGVAGMLHSFDGEYKEFGLYSPISSILDRLCEVTETSWGVLGVPSEMDDIDEKAELSS